MSIQIGNKPILGISYGGVNIASVYAGGTKIWPDGSAPPTISISSPSLVKGAGQTMSFTATAAGADPLTYQWLLNGAAISGATSATYNRTVLSTDNGKTISCRVTDTFAQSTTSSTLSMTVPAAPTVSISTSSSTPTSGTSFTLSASVSGYGTLSYEWKRSGVLVGTGTTYSTVAAQSTSGNYTLTVTDSLGQSTTSNSVNVTTQKKEYTTTERYANASNVDYGSQTVTRNLRNNPTGVGRPIYFGKIGASGGASPFWPWASGNWATQFNESISLRVILNGTSYWFETGSGKWSYNSTYDYTSYSGSNAASIGQAIATEQFYGRAFDYENVRLDY